ncbi:hypothetical protein P153DRAFT_335207 [Dothidotthia symphoricarpi CBS 119687]|uniref:separase n=1 Tax=Dothidotthia symphoricarpi CBS 119687 TaxID=1392245 RepID=A0A6A6AMQ2_9PLEO|nr:uncharacterized protein P153DRAFT_335207 [Dothidotthia symphoricarpi CBS 119687]KAF2132365.1 hypothetical protein P153DRAFT_335207 [Dothidotthia symphoricarpi CBS 119687]
MATKDQTARTRIDKIRAELRSTSTCSNTTVTALQELLVRNHDEPAQKENVRVKAQGAARRKAGTATATSLDVVKQTTIALAPREKYILATEVANTTLKNLANALRSQPPATAARNASQSKPAHNDDARKPTRTQTGRAKSPSGAHQALKERSVTQTVNSPQKRAALRRSSSYSSFLTPGPDTGLVATAECARIAFGYLGTLEATKVLGKDSQELQLENGNLALVGKLVAHGLDSLAIKEMKILKKRLDRFLGHETKKSETESEAVAGEKESLASLLDFRSVDPKSPALPLIANFQMYTLRVISRLNRPRIVEATWEYLKMSNPSSPVNLLWHVANTPDGQTKGARQLESLAQTILALCPSISSSDDENPLQPSADAVLSLQHLAFKVRKRWWALVKHRGNEEQELLEPFTRCIIAFSRRSKLSPVKKYKLAEMLYTDLTEQPSESGTSKRDASESTEMVVKTLSSLAQAAELSEEALRWLGSSSSSTAPNTSAAKQAAHLIRIATVSVEASMKSGGNMQLEDTIANALEALSGSLGGTSTDLDSLFMEANTLRRAASRLLVTSLSTQANCLDGESVQQPAVCIIAACVRFTARFIGARLAVDTVSKAQLRHKERMTMAWKCLKGVVDSVLTCCKLPVDLDDRWKELDNVLQECSHILQRFEEEVEDHVIDNSQETGLIGSCIVKLSNAYWTLNMKLRKANVDMETYITAMQRSVTLVQARPQAEMESAHFTMKLERLAETLENMNSAEGSRKALDQCIRSHLDSSASQILADLVTKRSIHNIFDSDGDLSTLARVLKSKHRSSIKFGVKSPDELAFYDDVELQPGIRGALLEYQLGLYLRTLSRNRQWDSSLDTSVVSLAERLREVYIPEKYPLRRLRISVMLLQLHQSQPHILPEQSLPSDFLDVDADMAIRSDDAELVRTERHLKALHNLKLLMQQNTPSASVVRQCFLEWESLVGSTASWGDLEDLVDNMEYWLQDIQASVDFLNAKGEEYLALPVLHLLVKIFELRKGSDVSELLSTTCSLALQYLRLGYTGKAGHAFVKAEALLGHKSISTEASLAWHLSYAEYLARIGNITKCTNILSTAQSIAQADSTFMDLAKPSTTLSGRLRFNRILADACYVYSLLATTVGSHKDAARHARQCVTVNRRIWSALESRVDSRKTANGPSKTPFDPLSSMRTEQGVPLVTSVTHDALGGASFWSLVPALYRGIMQHSQVFSNQGLLQEAIYVAEQAEKVASATHSPSLMIDNASWRAECWAQSGRSDKAGPILESIEELTSRKCLSVVGYHSAVARAHHWNGDFEKEIASYDTLEQLLGDLMSPSYIKTLDSFSPNIDALAEQIATMTLDVSEPQEVTTSTRTRGRKAASKPAPRTASKAAPSTRSRANTASAPKAAAKPKRKVVTPVAPEVLSTSDQCSILTAFHVGIMHRGVLANLLGEDIEKALDLLKRVEQLHPGLDLEVSHIWAKFKAMFAQTTKQIAEDMAFNTLPESTIAFPAIGFKDQTSSDGSDVKRVTPAASTTVRGGKGKKSATEDVAETLRIAREQLVQAHALAAIRGSNHLFEQISMALGHVTVLLSAISGGASRGSLHPLYAAYMSELPKCNALRLAQESTEAEREQMTRDECLQWPIAESSSFSFTSAPDFQKDYVDIIPETWTAISMALNDTRDELFITRFESGSSPFVLRLPLARHASRDMDEEEFSFEDGKKDFDEIIELSDFSTRTAQDMTTSEARRQWWAEREALDQRLHELLINMENIWLGGFRGVFSQHTKQPVLLAKFRKAFDTVLNRSLPSRRKKSQQKRVVLDARVLELFVGLGDATDEEIDLDEALMDLLYFVVDILQFNGERNAYDEIDFDAMVIETQDALRAYHSASHDVSPRSPHMIFILDKNLHAFPWESMPCLEKLSISRLPSLAALRERLLAAKPPTAQQDAAPGHYIQAESGGTSILNPSGDLSHTLSTLNPHIHELQGPWTHITSRAPSEKEFEDSLREKDLVLYFGHGSGAQFVRSKSVRRLYPGPQDELNTKPKAGCATTLLFGCSSAHLTENGIFEPSGMLAAYLTAGAPAVVGMLWDVTDKDCDRLAVRAGELWGLWPEVVEDSTSKSRKTPAKKTKGKGKAADVETARNAKTGKKGKAGGPGGEDSDLGAPRSRGVGLDEAIREARKSCVLRYLNGAAAVVYGIPVYLE